MSAPPDTIPTAPPSAVAREFDTDWTDYPVCPECGAEDQDWWDGLRQSMGDGDSWTESCGSCGADYTVTMCVSTSFSTTSSSVSKGSAVPHNCDSTEVVR
jgi:hypothetical protein